MYKDITKDTLHASRLAINNSDPWTGRVRIWEEMRDYSIPWLPGEPLAYVVRPSQYSIERDILSRDLPANHRIVFFYSFITFLLWLDAEGF